MSFIPLAERLRPHSLDEVIGQQHILGAGKPLRVAFESGEPHSMILWGPPGCGKTTLALLLAKYSDAEFKAISAVLSGLPEVRQVLAEAAHRFAEGRRTVLFVDEVHRFNKAQQDAFLPHIERGTILFVGATTENPSFELNSALLSRCRVHVMEAVSADDIAEALRRALNDEARGLGGRGLRIGDEALNEIAGAADGDVRRGLTLLEIAAELAGEGGEIDQDTLRQVLADRTRRFDKGGEQFYDQISALHKSRHAQAKADGAVVEGLARVIEENQRLCTVFVPAQAIAAARIDRTRRGDGSERYLGRQAGQRIAVAIEGIEPARAGAVAGDLGGLHMDLALVVDGQRLVRGHCNGLGGQVAQQLAPALRLGQWGERWQQQQCRCRSKNLHGILLLVQ